MDSTQSTARMLPPDPSWNEIAARAGVEPPMLKPSDHGVSAMLDAELYWPVGADHPAQEARRCTTHKH